MRFPRPLRRALNRPTTCAFCNKVRSYIPVSMYQESPDLGGRPFTAASGLDAPEVESVGDALQRGDAAGLDLPDNR